MNLFLSVEMKVHDAFMPLVFDRPAPAPIRLTLCYSMRRLHKIYINT